MALNIVEKEFIEESQRIRIEGVASQAVKAWGVSMGFLTACLFMFGLSVTTANADDQFVTSLALVPPAAMDYEKRAYSSESKDSFCSDPNYTYDGSLYNLLTNQFKERLIRTKEYSEGADISTAAASEYWGVPYFEKVRADADAAHLDTASYLVLGDAIDEDWLNNQFLRSALIQKVRMQIRHLDVCGTVERVSSDAK